MVEIGKAIVSLDLFREYFTCDLEQCKGACCIEGDSGAPLAPGEPELLEQDYPRYRDFLPPDHRNVIENKGFSLVDSDGDVVTPLVLDRQFAYSYNDDQGILKCAVEKAWNEGYLNFRKPLSCHLFPVRITAYRHFDAVNYQKIEICRPGRECGKKIRMPLWRFLQVPLTRKYGEEWFAELQIAADQINRP